MKRKTERLVVLFCRVYIATLLAILFYSVTYGIVQVIHSVS